MVKLKDTPGVLVLNHLTTPGVEDLVKPKNIMKVRLYLKMEITEVLLMTNN